ncbi:hypothetical protein QTH51_10110 [Clostridium perfringens]|nr:hypothetical protein [Clostridium perfringens]MDM0460710.1 hypothetical protein [Clostridium perfringens]
MKINNIRIIWTYITIYFICFTTGGDLIGISNFYKNLGNIMIVILSIYPVFKMITNKKCIKFNFFVLPTIIIISLIINNGIKIDLFSFIVRFYCILSDIHYIINKKIDFFEIFNKIVYFFAVTSLIFYFTIMFLNLPHQSYIYNGIEHRNYFYLFSTNQYIDILGYRLIRNNSIFWEPGMFQIYLNISLFYQLFFRGKINIKYTLIFILALITTTSTMGIIILIIMIITKVLLSKFKNKYLNLLKMYPIIILVFISMYMLIFLIRYKEISSVMSYNTRIMDFEIGFKLFLMKPIYGWGYLNYEIYNFYANTNVGNSNGLISLAFQMGIIGVLVYILLCFWLFKYLNMKYKNKIYAINFILLLSILNIAQPIIYSNLVMMFLSVGLIINIIKTRSTYG